MQYWKLTGEVSPKEDFTRLVARESWLGRHETMLSLMESSEVMSCWRTSRLLGQLPPRRMARYVARSFESSSGKKGTLSGKRVRRL